MKNEEMTRIDKKGEKVGKNTKIKRDKTDKGQIDRGV
jgi:hypothetical protein